MAWPGSPRVSRSSVVRASDQCAECHRFDSCPGIRFFFCPVLPFFFREDPFAVSFVSLVFIQKWRDHMLLMTSYLITITTDCHQPLPRCVLRVNQQLINGEKNLKGGRLHPLPTPNPNATRCTSSWRRGGGGGGWGGGRDEKY